MTLFYARVMFVDAILGAILGVVLVFVVTTERNLKKISSKLDEIMELLRK